MYVTNRREPLLLLLGDIIILYATLWLTLTLRYQALPSEELFISHLIPFSILFLIWIAVFFIAGLYDKHTLFFKSRLPRTVFLAQLANVALAISFFYTIPYFVITPKTNLFLYLLISSGFILAWRRLSPQLLSFRSPQTGLLVGKGTTVDELEREINENGRYNLYFAARVDPETLDPKNVHQEILNTVYEREVSFVVIDIQDEQIAPVLPHLYNLIYARVHFIELPALYEEVFDCIPLEVISYGWFLEHLSFYPHTAYDALKRGMDIVVATILGLFSLIAYPFIMLAIYIESVRTQTSLMDGTSVGSVFYTQERTGQENRVVRLYKFRTMTTMDTGQEALSTDGKITRVGAFLRRTRLDELPQLWSVVRGDLSLIGPRPEIPELVAVYEEKIPYYNVRHLIKPGLSGWAQLRQLNPARFGADTDLTESKLSYDLYYVKNRSLILDVKIALQTIKTLLSRSGQ